MLQQIDEIFHVGGGLGAGVVAGAYLRVGDTERALDYLERLTKRLIGRQEPPNPLLFVPQIAPEPEKLEVSMEFRQVVLQALKKDACFDPLRGNERFQALVNRLAESLENT